MEKNQAKNNKSEDTENSSIKNNYSLEPSLFLVIFGWGLSSTVFTNQLVYQTCTDVYHYNKTICTLLGTKNGNNMTEDLEAEMQPYVANILLAKQLIEVLFGTLMCLRLGPWSDLHGRKPVLVIIYIGALIQLVVMTTIVGLSTRFSIDPWWYIAATIPLAITGGNPTLTTVAFSYVSDINSQENRALRNGITQGVILVSVLIGSILSGFLYNWTNATTVFGLSSACTFLGLIHIIFTLKDVVKDQNQENRCSDIVMPELFKEIATTAMKKRQNYDRAVLWLILIAVGIASFCTDGSLTVFYLFVRKKLGWTIENYAVYLSVNMLFGATGSIIALVGLKKLVNLSDTILTICGYFSALVQSLVIALANKSWEMYLAVLVGGIKNISIVTCRSILTNMGPDSDIGKMNALITSTESIFQLAGAPVFTQLYKATLNTNPGAFNFLSILIYMIDVVLLICVYVVQKIVRKNAVFENRV